MTVIRPLTTFPLVVALLVACASEAPTGIDETSTGVIPLNPVRGAAEAAIGGNWNWSNVEVIRMPPFIAASVGIIPEGPNTLARCESAGTMTLVPSGDTFEGTAIKTSNYCQTLGGQTFQQPGSPFVIEDGQRSGAALSFSFATVIVRPCPHQALITAVENGVATGLSGTGRCVLPGHPASESPLDLNPPPGGTSTTVSWEAERQ